MDTTELRRLLSEASEAKRADQLAMKNDTFTARRKAERALEAAAVNALPHLLAVVEAVRAADLAHQHEANCEMWRKHHAKYGGEVTCRCGLDALRAALANADAVLSTAEAMRVERDDLRAKLARAEGVVGHMRDIAEHECAYRDGCPTFGSRHGQCTGCKAREALATYEEG